MTSMHVPSPVMSLALSPKAKGNLDKFGKALNRFTKEDPTFRVGFDAETKQTVISGMGELHLQIYVERIKREYGVECDVGQPRVNYRERYSLELLYWYKSTNSDAMRSVSASRGRRRSTTSTRSSRAGRGSTDASWDTSSRLRT
jgi:translation elongation factor EF-G